MDCVGWLWVAVLCSLLVRASATSGMGRNVLNDLERVSPILLEMGCWETFVCVWTVLAIFSILAISMVRSKNTGKGKATSSSMERAVKKQKVDTSQMVKKGKGKQEGSSSESEEESESQDEEIELCFMNHHNPSEKGGSSQLNGEGSTVIGGMKIETFLFTHPIHVVIQDLNLQFFGEEVKGYLLSIVREFYSNLRENLNVDSLLETTISGKQLIVSSDPIARSLHYDHPATHDKPYPLKAIT